MQHPNDPEQGRREPISLTPSSEPEIVRIKILIGQEEQDLWFEVPQPEINLPLFEKVTGVVEHLLEPSVFQTRIIRKAIIEEFEKHGFKQHLY